SVSTQAMTKAGPSTGSGYGRSCPPRPDQKPLAASNQISTEITLEEVIAGQTSQLTRQLSY
ncbi:hypothetical protein AB9F35_34455, partial [Rhizobium leguminosarum]|uniref:hypothetical protein n=1 Tax=Rhizobium leguminosarum TaxID=384 RepID=UPI003F954590